MRKKGRFWWGTASVALFFTLWAFYTPIPFTALKIAVVGCLGALLLIVGVGFKRGWWTVLPIVAAVLVCGFWPPKKPEAAQLRARYLKSLRAYKGTPYVWGGENGRGIDCSGLMRRGMVDALMAQGWQDKNPSLWREAAQVWWKDCSAAAMKDGYDGRIQTLFTSKSLNALDTARLQTGDLAVLQSGVHVLAFVGGKTWIQADPNLVNGGDKVIETTAPSRNGWFGQPVVVCRWKMLTV